MDVLNRTSSEDFDAKVDNWHNSVTRWLKQRFSNDELASNFVIKRPAFNASSAGSTWPPVASFEIKRFHDTFVDRVDYLAGIVNDLHLFLPSEDVGLIATPRQLTLNIQHLGQLNLDTNTVNNIQSQISGIAAQGNPDLAEALAAFTNGLEDDEVTPDQRAEVAELVEGLGAEVAAPSEKRSLSRVRAFVHAVPVVLQGASKALALWSQVDQILRDKPLDSVTRVSLHTPTR
jgi:hypothetical protein